MNSQSDFLRIFETFLSKVDNRSSAPSEQGCSSRIEPTGGLTDNLTSCSEALNTTINASSNTYDHDCRSFVEGQ